ncbi:hypothetical protein PM038_00090 [Halorubrum ezzemoulense]|uniref:hypothetical protein n=1 Tax=Halorubrum ezzemoulense TaxID=337243 RepID=UPI00232BC1B0|nr:hypothetical protein [Halorubrum ezzemoulense]MDB2283674.1 hypothetical protein [Halorubrum ezzemoulense]
MNRRLLAVAGLVLLVGLSGCATIEVTAEVGDANTIDRYEANISTSTTVYGLLNSQAQEEGYEDLGDQLRGGRDIDSDRFEYSEEIDGDGVNINIEVTDLPVENSTSISIEEQDGQLVYTDETFLNESAQGSTAESEYNSELLSGLTLEYTLVMPGEISNATTDDVEGNTATWTNTGENAWSDTRIRAQSEAGSPLSTPGFGVPAAALALLAAALIGLKREL